MEYNILINSCFLFALSLMTFIENGDSYYYGRHVCTERKKVQHPVPVTKSYKRPVYRKDLGKVVYVTAHRTTFKMEMRVQMYRTCCKGWEKRVPREAGCLVPVCKEKCLNGGQCIAPDLCLCSEGFAGYRCQTDINECSGRHECQQKCVNLPGTYECACRKGFVLAEDEMSCDLCLTCTPEFKMIEEKLGAMGRQMTMLEKEKNSLQKNLTRALSQYQIALNKIHEMETSAQELMTSRPKTTTTATTTDYLSKKDKYMPLDRLASLSRQISMLEERMASCACDEYY